MTPSSPPSSRVATTMMMIVGTFATSGAMGRRRRCLWCQRRCRRGRQRRGDRRRRRRPRRGAGEGRGGGRGRHSPLASPRSIIEKYHSNATMSWNLKNDGLIGLQNDDLDCDGLAMVVDDNCEFTFEGKSYRSYDDYVQAKRSRTAGIFANSGMLAARLAIAEEMTAPGPRRAKNSRDDVDMPPLLPRRKSSRRTVSKGIDLAATMQSSSPAGLRVVITNGSLSMTTSR